MKPDQLVALLLERFAATEQYLRENNIDGNTPWSRAILTGLSRLGQEREFYVCASPRFVDASDRDDSEFLYDLVWIRRYDEDRMRMIKLVAECEWGNCEDVLEDFQKLLVARATGRLIVYGMDKAGDMTEELRAHIHAFQGEPDDTYLLVAYNENEEDWRLEYVVLVVNDEGGTNIDQQGTIENGEIHPAPQ